LIKKLTIDYELNKTTNKELINFMEDVKNFYFISLPGYILITIGLIILIIIFSQRKMNVWVAVISALAIFLNFLALIGSSSANVKFSSKITIKPNFYQNYFNKIIVIDKIIPWIPWINIPLTVFFIFFYCYIFFYINENCCGIFSKSDNNYESFKDKKTTVLQSKYNSDS